MGVGVGVGVGGASEGERWGMWKWVGGLGGSRVGVAGLIGRGWMAGGVTHPCSAQFSHNRSDI